MPRKGGKRSRPRKSKKSAVATAARSDTTSVAFKGFVTASFTGGTVINVTSTTSALNSRISALADYFEEYSFKKLKFRLQPVPSQTVDMAVGYLPTPVEGTPSLASVCQSPHSAYLNGKSITPTKWVTVPPPVLRGLLSWYKTRDASTIDNLGELQGAIVIGGAGTITYNLEAEGVVSFRGSADPLLTPKFIENSRARDRARLIHLLNTTVSCTQLTPTDKKS